MAGQELGQCRTTRLDPANGRPGLRPTTARAAAKAGRVGQGRKPSISGCEAPSPATAEASVTFASAVAAMATRSSLPSAMAERSTPPSTAGPAETAVANVLVGSAVATLSKPTRAEARSSARLRRTTWAGRSAGSIASAARA
ncbi:MAG: hypothetical protein U0835_13190 [Isosphaeraceae bacterium]